MNRKNFETLFLILYKKRERWSEVFPTLPEPLPEKASKEKVSEVFELIKNLGKAKRFEEKKPVINGYRRGNDSRNM